MKKSKIKEIIRAQRDELCDLEDKLCESRWETANRQAELDACRDSMRRMTIQIRNLEADKVIEDKLKGRVRDRVAKVDELKEEVVKLKEENQSLRDTLAQIIRAVGQSGAL